MARFRYTATDADGQTVSGFVESDSAEQAREDLEARGLSPIDVEPDSAPDAKSGSAAQAEAVSQAGQLIAAGVPLSAGLRALAEETRSKELRRVLSHMADRLEAGDDLNEVFSSESIRLPAYLKGLIHAGTRMGDLASGVDHYVQFSQLRTRLHNRIRISLAYPLLLFAIGVLIMSATLYFVLPQFKITFDGFGTQLPRVTIAMLDLSSLVVVAVRYWPVTVATICVLPFIVRSLLQLMAGPAVWRRALYLVPLFGPTLRYAALAEYCHLLAILIDHRLPLPEAFKLAGDGISDWNLREGSYALSGHVEAGKSPAQTETGLHFPRDILAVLSWDRGETVDGQRPGDALRGAGEIYAAHAEVHSRTITAILEPAAIFMVACLVSLIVVAMFMPMVKLLNDLS